MKFLFYFIALIVIAFYPSSLFAAEFSPEEVTSDLSIPCSIDFTRYNSPTDFRMLISQRTGSIIAYENGKKYLIYNDFGTMSNDTRSEGGVLGLAVDPNYSQNKLYYVMYSRNTGNGR